MWCPRHKVQLQACQWICHFRSLANLLMTRHKQHWFDCGCWVWGSHCICSAPFQQCSTTLLTKKAASFFRLSHPARDRCNNTCIKDISQSYTPLSYLIPYIPYDWHVTVNVSGDKPINRAQWGKASMETLASSMVPVSHSAAFFGFFLVDFFDFFFDWFCLLRFLLRRLL